MTEKKIAKGYFIVKNDRGLHTRPSMEFVRCAGSFESDIYLSYQKYRVNAKSIMGILMLAAGKGARVRVEAEGIDAEEALNSIIQLAKSQFYINY